MIGQENKKRRLPLKKDILRELEEVRKKDFSFKSGRILNSMCTSPIPFAKKVFFNFIETNLGDPGLFRGTKELEDKAIAFLGELLNKRQACGAIVTGGTEANIMALWVAKNKEKKKNPEVIAPESMHFSFYKACNLLSLKLKAAKINKKNEVDIKDVKRKISKNTIAIVGIAGTTEYGSIDDIEALSELALENNIYLHVDAAFGGFVIPFLDINKKFDFSVEGVCSITIDPHKMGLVPIPCGGILFREKKLLEYISTPTPYLTEKKQFTLTGTRSGASAAAAYAIFKLLGREGYKKVVRRCMRVTYYLYNEIKKLGFAVIPPTLNILVFSSKNNDLIEEELRKRGWAVSRTRKREIRMVLMPHIKMKHARLFIKDLKEICERS